MVRAGMNAVAKVGKNAEAAKRRLAQRLYEVMEFLDPSDAAAWDAIEPSSRDFYEHVVGNLLLDTREVLRAIDAPDSDFIDRGSCSGE